MLRVAYAKWMGAKVISILYALKAFGFVSLTFKFENCLNMSHKLFFHLI